MIEFPRDEFERLMALPAYGLDIPGRRPMFDTIASFAATLFDAPLAMINVAGLDELWTCGSNVEQVPSRTRASAVCSRALLGDDLLEMTDLSLEPAFAAIDAGNGELLRYYAGVPIRSAAGVALGVLCVSDVVVRAPLDDGQRGLLHRLAGLAAGVMEEQRALLSTQNQLHDHEQLYRRTLHLSRVMLWQADALGQHITFGIGEAGPTRISVGQHAGWINRIHPDDIEGLLLRWRSAVAEGTTIQLEVRVSDERGRYRWHHINGAAHRDRHKRVTGWYGVVADIDERKRDSIRLRRAEAELNHVAQVTAMGTMASTLAHELNQPLAAIGNFVHGSIRLIEAGGATSTTEVLAALRIAADTTRRAGEIVRSLRELVSHAVAQRRRTFLPDLVREACRIACAGSPVKDVELVLALDTARVTVLVDSAQIQQVVINLVRNALDVLSRADDRRIDVIARVLDAASCEVAVTDNGAGIEPQIAERLFAPFNSSKSDGMGVGLSISRTIIEAHGGAIRSAPGDAGGTTFTFTLPIAPELPPA